MPMYLVIYDITEDSRRLKLSQFLERWGLRRIQRSAFIGYIADSRARDIARQAELIIDKESDIVHVIPIDRREWMRAYVVGTAKWTAGAPERELVIK